MTLSGDDTLAKEMLAKKLGAEIAELVLFMQKAYQFEKDGEGDGKTHTIMRVVREDDLHDILDEWIDHIRGEADGEEVSESRDQMLRIDVEDFFDKSGMIRPNDFKLTRTQNETWSYASGWDDWGVEIKIDGDDLDSNSYFTEVPRGFCEGEPEMGVSSTVSTFSMDEDEILELYEAGKDFDRNRLDMI